MKLPDVSHSVKEMDVPLCPFCDNPIHEFEPSSLWRAHGYVGLGHEDCVSEIEDEREDMDGG